MVDFGGLVIVLVAFLAVLVTLFQAVRMVPQGSKWVVERLGKFHRALSPGLNLLVPFIDRVAFKATTNQYQYKISISIKLL